MDHSTPPPSGDAVSGPAAPLTPNSGWLDPSDPSEPVRPAAASPMPLPTGAPMSALAAPTSGRQWWQRKILTFPISVWMLAALTFFVVLGVFSLLENRGQSDGTDSGDETAQSAVNADSAGESTGLPTPAPLPPTPSIDGCTPASADMIAAVNSGLSPGLTLGLAYTATDDAGRAIVGGSIFQTDDAERISGPDIWVIDNQVTYAVNSSASSFSDFSNAALLPNSPTALDAPYAAIHDNCVVPAIAQTPGS